MNSEDLQPIEDNTMDFLTFKELVEQITGSRFEEVYTDYLMQGANYESDLE